MPVLRFSAAATDELNENWRLYGDGAPETLRRGVEEANGAKDLGAVARPDSRYLNRIGGPIHDHITDFASAQGLGDREQPIIVFLHGFQFDPRRAPEIPPGETKAPPGKSANPHVQLYHFDEIPDDDRPAAPGSKQEHDSHATPWLRRAAPERLGDDFPGLALAYAYESWGGSLEDDTPSTFQLIKALADVERRYGRLRNTYARAFIDADMAADALAGVLTQLDAILTEQGDMRPIDIFAHSLGTRTALLTLEKLALQHPQSKAFARMGRTLLLAGSASWMIGARVLRNLRRARRGDPPEIYNFTSESDDVLTLLGARAAARATLDEADRPTWWLSRLIRFARGGRVIGSHGRPWISAMAGGPYPAWVDVQLDDRDTMRRAAEHGFTLVGKRDGLADILDHWVHYTDPLNWDLYRAILYDRAAWDVEAVRGKISPDAA